MRKLIFVVLAASLYQAQSALADDNQCQQIYSSTISACAQSLGSLDQSIRPGAQKGCVQQAKAAKDACASGANTCLDTCQSTYNAETAYCSSYWDSSICGLDNACLYYYQQQLALCNDQATADLNTCTASCPTL